jgi:hypothetical protein
MRRTVLLVGLALVLLVGLAGSPSLYRPATIEAATDIYASPIHGGCYIAGPSDCRLHVDPFTINVVAGQKLAQFRLVATQGGTGTQTVIHDFRPDQSNPVPLSGTTYTPSLVAQDYACTCGRSYTISLQGRDTGDPSVYNLGLTGQFTCPTAVP